MIKKIDIIPTRSIISLKYIQDTYCSFGVKDGNLVITIPYNNPKIANNKYRQIKKDLNFFDYMCYNCGCWFKQKTVWKDKNKHMFCSQKCIDIFIGLRKNR